MIGIPVFAMHVKVVTWKLYNFLFQKGDHAFQYACSNGHLDIAKFIFTKVKHLGGEIPINWTMALYGACIGGHLKCIEFIEAEVEAKRAKAQGKNSEALIDWSWALRGACDDNQLEIAKLAINKGANDFNPCLFTTCLHGYVEIVHLLLINGVKLNIDTNINYYYSWPDNKKGLVQLLYLGIPRSWLSKIIGYDKMISRISIVENSILSSDVMLLDLLKIIAQCIII